jgi:hypothetical protein
MSHGGKREGAGRPKGKVSKETQFKLQMQQQLIRKVKKEFTPLLEAMLELAKGHYVSVQTEKGETKIFKKPPNVEMIKYLTDQTIGKAKESLDINTLGEHRHTVEGNLNLQSEKTNEIIKALNNFGILTTDEHANESTCTEPRSPPDD